MILRVHLRVNVTLYDMNDDISAASVCMYKFAIVYSDSNEQTLSSTSCFITTQYAVFNKPARTVFHTAVGVLLCVTQDKLKTTDVCPMHPHRKLTHVWQFLANPTLFFLTMLSIKDK